MRFQVGDELVIDTELRKVWLGSQDLILPERSYALLLTLVEQAPNIVSHDTLIQSVWPGRVVSDENLKQRVSRLRKSLNNADYFLAERGLGYRLTAPVVRVEPCDAPTKTVSLPDDNPAEKVIDAAVQSEVIPATGQKLIAEQPLPARRSKLKWLALAAACGLVVFAAISYKQTPVQNQGKLGEFTARDYNQKGIDYYYRFKPTDNDTAISLFQKATNADPNFAPAYSSLGNAYAQGYFQYGKGEDWLAQSMAHSNRAIEIDVNHPYGYKSLALAQHLAGRFDDAIANYSKAIELAPWWQSPVNNRAFVSLEAGQLIDAHADALKTIEMDVKDPIPYLFIGLIYSRLGMQAHALKSINHSIDLKPDYLLAQNYLAQYHLSHGELDKAEPLLANIIAGNPTSQFAHWLLAHTRLQLGQTTQAEMHFAKAAELGGRHKLPSQTQVALLQQDMQSLNQLYQRLNDKLHQGIQWPDIHLSKAFIEASRGEHELALSTIKDAIDQGMLQKHRIALSPWFAQLNEKPRFIALMTMLDEKIDQQRQAVMSKNKQ